ncbi:MAG: 4-alpha-glucanotransferase [Candidatus Gastranaerophilales bacterium]|nr:4-alpha-glucanotransferase [Candidatus Gastranaerophilales bacterium]
MSDSQTMLKLGEEYKLAIRKALRLLGKKNLSLIIHGASFPAVDEQDTGFGSFTSQGARNLVDFTKDIFSSIQLGPAGKTKSVDSSPYTGTVFSDNPLFIDLYQLTQENYATLLSMETFEQIVANNPQKGNNKTAYSYIYEKQNLALKETYNTFLRKIENKDSKALSLNKEFEKFKNNNSEWLEKDAIYEALSVKHNNDYWPHWNDEIDRNLYNMETEEGKIAASQRIEQLKTNYGYEIEFYNFTQFLISKQKEEMKNYALKNGIKMIADRQVAFSDRDCWANQSLFLKGWCLGCPPDYFSKDGQAWGFNVMDPEKLFSPDGSLGEGGVLMFNLFRKMFKENPGGVRIDHFVGLVDPWVYKAGKTPKVEDGAGRLYSSPEHPELSKYAIPSVDDLNMDVSPDNEYRVKTLTPKQISLYARLIEKIIIAAAKTEGVDKDSIICEDLGTLTYPVEQVMKQFELNGMRVTQFVKPEDPNHSYRGKNTKEKDWIMLGTHDNEPISFWAKATIKTPEIELHAKNLADDLCWDEHYIGSYVDILKKNPMELAKAKCVELFAANAQNIQIFFSDFFGIEDVYNKPGTSGDANWALRLPNNFEWFYFNQLVQGKALNLAEILAYALKVRGLDKDNADLIQKLENYAKI